MRFSEYVAIREYFCRNQGMPIHSERVELAVVEDLLNKKIVCYDRYEIANNPFVAMDDIIARVVVNMYTQEIVYRESYETNRHNGRAGIQLYSMPSSLRHSIQQKNRPREREDFLWTIEKACNEIPHPAFYWKGDDFIIS